MLYIQVRCMYIFKGGRDGNIFKVGVLIEAHLWQWSHIWWVIYICEGPKWPINLNSDWIHHKTFLTLDFITDFVTYEIS